MKVFSAPIHVILSKSVDGKRNYQKQVVFVDWKDKKFQKNFPGNTKFKRFCLICLIYIKGCVRYIFASWFFKYKWQDLLN